MNAHRPSVLFVCLGNICRSPLAEAALRHQAQATGLDLMVDSAGTGSWHIGNPPDPRSRAEALRHGIDISSYRARQVCRDDFTRFEQIVALDHQNLADLRQAAPATSRARLTLLLDHVPGMKGQDVADPYFGGPEGFEATWRQVHEATGHLLEAIRRASR
ncbi:low molecular weight protein-tyrosine-phosphatase [Novosphingobium album (ex Hu et al. 2023)]|uniref:protein-tyrosine-phosphatase n=1 Tax=Novosphingobium album (ex Hu et al. 2023) TaxID=2930093 RepID=A0ABT0B326_9SPHN|nr:low molecular weight protein-tyrosine-phosphatase [Novosphingobium album (ex Hu et al. 2023)]MCJ2179457.1 low molecular weight phosphotyrosine protein phosphatase [Novosphingobium album (ex Hu et al. 2023)]